jgi:hypothetical protein
VKSPFSLLISTQAPTPDYKRLFTAFQYSGSGREDAEDLAGISPAAKNPVQTAKAAVPSIGPAIKIDRGFHDQLLFVESPRSNLTS